MSVSWFRLISLFLSNIAVGGEYGVSVSLRDDLSGNLRDSSSCNFSVCATRFMSVSFTHNLQVEGDVKLTLCK